MSFLLFRKQSEFFQGIFFRFSNKVQARTFENFRIYRK